VVKDKKEVFKFIVKEKILIQKLSQVQVKGGLHLSSQTSRTLLIFSQQKISHLLMRRIPPSYVCSFDGWFEKVPQRLLETTSKMRLTVQ